MISWILSLAGNLILRHSSSAILRQVGTHLSQGDDNAHKVAMREIDAQIEARKNATQIRLATSAFWEQRLITFIIAACFTSHLVLVTLDTNLKLGWKVPKFPEPFDEWQGLILLSYFGVQVAGHGIKMAAIAWMTRK